MRARTTPGAAGNSATGLSTGDADNHIRQTCAHKWQRVLRELLKGPQTTRNLEREPSFDHCAHSTASELRKKGIGIDTEIIEIEGYAGLPARVAKYTLTPEGRERALRILGEA